MSYSRVEYDIFSANDLETLFEDSDREMKCRKRGKVTKK